MTIKQAFDNLVEDVQFVYTRLNVVNLYPDGADKQRAIRDLEKAKSKLLVDIGIYDTLRAESLNMLNEKGEDTYSFEITHPKSHDVIEQTYAYITGMTRK